MGVFLLTIAFVFTFIPSLTAPFIDGNQEQTAVADRVASHLVEGSLADPNDPYVLNVTCTTAFFADNTAPAGCSYDVDGFQNRIGVSNRADVNVTLARVDAATRDKTLLCDTGDGTVVKADSADCDPSNDGVVYQIGDEPSDRESVTVARRVVTIDGQDATLLVKVW
ncbi:hypothetical protein [Natronomonas sp.]